MGPSTASKMLARKSASPETLRIGFAAAIRV
jgi:hypothetical protein